MLLVEATGVEPVSENLSIQTSSGVVCYSGKAILSKRASRHAFLDIG